MTLSFVLIKPFKNQRGKKKEKKRVKCKIPTVRYFSSQNAAHKNGGGNRLMMGKHRVKTFKPTIKLTASLSAAESQRSQRTSASFGAKFLPSPVTAISRDINVFVTCP